MDQILHAHFERVEAALNALVDSISSYNPSPAAALDLVAADDELSKGLEQLAVHQANHARILELRQTADTLDTQVKSSLNTLAETRKELLATPVTAVPKNSRDVPLDELLAYARRISKFTVPPTYRPPLPGEAKEGLQTTPTADAKMENGVPSPAVGATPTATQTGQEGTQSSDAAKKEEGVGVSSLTDEQRAWLDSASQIPFVPWPSEDTIRKGALAGIQHMLEQGKDPTTFVPEPAAGSEHEAGQEDESQRMDTGDTQHVQGVPGAIARPPPQEQGSGVFGGLELYNPDD